MRTLFNYIRSLFCKHDFEYEEVVYNKYFSDGQERAKNIIVSRTCKKCGWHKSYKKFKSI